MLSTVLSSAPLPATLPAAHAEIEALRARLLRQQQGLAVTQLHAAWMQAVHEGFLLLDADDRVLVINDGYCQLLGLPSPASYWVGRPGQELTEQVILLVADPEAHRAVMGHSRAHQQAEYGTRVVLRDGRVLERDFLPYADEDGLCCRLVHYRDVTGPQQVEEHLRTISRIPAQNPNPILRLGTDHQQLYANPAAERLRAELSPADARLLQQQAFAWADTALISGQDARYTISVGARHLTASVVPFPAEHYVNLYLVDITERVLAEQGQLEQQAFTRQVLDTSPNLVYVRDAAGNTLFENYAMQRLRNEARLPAASGTDAIALIQQSERAHYAAADARVLATGQEVTAEDPLTLPTGEVQWFYTVKRPLRWVDSTTHVLGVSTDITELKRTQHTLERSQKRYRDLQHHTQALIFTHALDGRVLSANPALAQLLGCRPEDLVGREVASVMPHEDTPAFYAYLERIADMGEEQGVQRMQPAPEASLHYLLYRAVVVREDGEAPYVIVHSHDISERVAAERTLRQAKRAAEAAARARENFLANMSHEIRTPLNGVLGMAAQLNKTSLNPRQQELVSIIRSSGQHLLGVINDVLDMAKITSGKLELASETFNLCDSMAQAVQPLALQAQEKGIVFESIPLRHACPYPWVVGDAHRLNQILINLVSNALKFTPAGGHIAVDGYLLDETDETITVKFSVTDSGVGIAPDKIERIFESFTQAYADTSRLFGGTGLGLSISRALVEQMGGTLTVESEMGQGSTFAFQITLPRATGAVPEAALAGYDTGALRGRRLLLIEDNEINRLVARLLLEEWGAVLDEAVDGPTGLELLSQRTYDAVLMDIQMPGMNGLEVTAAIRQLPDPVRATVPILALTANAFQADTEQYLAAGMNNCVAKPFEEGELFTKLATLLAPPAYDLTALRALARGNATFVQRVLRSFLTNVPATLTQLRTAAATEQWTELARLIHHLKPSLAALGVAEAEPLVAALEDLRQTPPAPAAVPGVRATTEQLAALVTRVVGTLPQDLNDDAL